MRVVAILGALVLGLPLLVANGCTNDAAPELVIEPGLDAGGDAVLTDGDDDGEADVARDDADSAPDGVMDAEVTPVIVGITPTWRSPDDGGGAGALEGEAVVLALSSGARALVLERSWFELAGEPSEALDQAWTELANVCSFLATQRRWLMIDLKTVDGVLDGRPPGIRSVGWSQQPTRQAMHALVDKLFATCGEEFLYLSLGADVDRYLEAHPDESSSFTLFALDTSDYVKAHPARPSQLGAGWTWTAKAWLMADGMKESDALVAASDAVMISYCPLDDEQHAKAPSVVSSELSALTARVKALPIVLKQTAYPTAELIGGSEAAQAQFIEGMFGSVGAHRSRFPFVHAGLLHDPTPDDCVGYAEAQGEPGSAELFAVWCSVGLRTRGGAAKAGFAAFVEAAAGLQVP